MEIVVIVRDALASSVIGSLLLAIEAKKAGQAVGVVFTQEALAALAQGTFAWPRELTGQAMRLTLADRGAKLGVPWMARGEGRQLDAKGLVAKAAEAGVPLYACPIWSALLGLEDGLPAGLQAVATTDFLALVRDAQQVIGTL